MNHKQLLEETVDFPLSTSHAATPETVTIASRGKEIHFHWRKGLTVSAALKTGTDRGIRHIRGLPVRGQRTKTNSRTRRGNVRKTAGSGRKSSNEKT